MTTSYTPSLSHLGILCQDLGTMSRFYCEMFDMTQTDSGDGITLPRALVFLSGSPWQHHQLALASGRGPDMASTVMQIAFRVPSLHAMREAKRRAEVRQVRNLRALNHGNALSIYFSDPEDNTVEVYLDTPWYVRQPHADPLDLGLPDEVIWAETEAVCRADPTFMTVDDWRARFPERQADALS